MAKDDKAADDKPADEKPAKDVADRTAGAATDPIDMIVAPGRALQSARTDATGGKHPVHHKAGTRVTLPREEADRLRTSGHVVSPGEPPRASEPPVILIEGQAAATQRPGSAT